MMSAAIDHNGLPPLVQVIAKRPDAAAILCSFNGVQHRAVVEVGEGNRVRPHDIADMLEALARQVRAS